MRLPQTSAARSVVLCFLALVLGSLLNAEGLRKTAETQPQGLRRTLALDVTRPLVRVSRALHLSTPRHELQIAIGREGVDRIDTTVRQGARPVARRPGRRPPPRAAVPSAATRPPAARTSATPAAARAVTSREPLRIWVGGDSLAQVPGEALERRSGGPTSEIDVRGVESRLSTGLARPDLYNWFTRFGEVISDVRPDVAVLSFGADDAHDYMAGVPRGRTVGPLGSPSWRAEYRRRVAGVTREFNAAGIVTIWIGLPIPAGPGFKRSFPVVNSILRSVAAAHAKESLYVDTWHMLDSAHGTYTPYLRVNGKLTLLRLTDGVHYTAAAGDLIAERILRDVSRVYGLAR
jgi:hypothetical protein